MDKQLFDTAAKTGLEALKTAFRKVVHQAAENTKLLADKIVKPKPVYDENLRYVAEIIISPKKREEVLNELRQVL